MKAIQRTYLIFSFLLTAFAVSGQNEADALRYSGTYYLGTARSMGMAGAFSAVGADYSATHLNPGGLGVYKRAEVHLSLQGAEVLAVDAVRERPRGQLNILLSFDGGLGGHDGGKLSYCERWKEEHATCAVGKHPFIDIYSNISLLRNSI